MGRPKGTATVNIKVQCEVEHIMPEALEAQEKGRRNVEKSHPTSHTPTKV